jgi:PBP1b-binding outer membrane lipoprotein LpoB
MNKMLSAISLSFIFFLIGCTVPTSTNTPTHTLSRAIKNMPTATNTSTRTPARVIENMPTAPIFQNVNPGAFNFISMGDGQAETVSFTTTVNQISTLHPELVIFNGDLGYTGVVPPEMNPMVAALKNAGLFNQTFAVRGNHDNKISGSAALWESYFETSPNIRVLPAGVTDYVSLDSNSDYLNYSFIYENAMFIGLDVPGNVGILTSTQLIFMDARLTYAESRGLDHAFIFFHGPLYCVESTHCDCTERTDASCTPAALVSVLNIHPIVSTTFHGHEHILGWTHMDNTRVAGLTGSFEEIFTSPSGGWTHNDYLYPARMDYTYMDMEESQAFASISVSGMFFTVNFYEVGTSAPVWTKTFIKGVQ